MIYTGIGSRETPIDVLRTMTRVGRYLASEGHTLRSGKAAGADLAFQIGVENFCYFVDISFDDLILAEIYIPWSNFNSDRDDISSVWDVLVTDKQIIANAEEIASRIHPAWDKCSQGAKKLHTRNVYQVLGATLDKPSDFVICYAKVDKSGKVMGGTATAVNLAKEYEIPVFNLFVDGDLDKLRKFLKENW